MEHDIQYDQWYVIEGPRGTEYVSSDLVGFVPQYVGELTDIPAGLEMYCENDKCTSITLKEGWGARLSMMPGYLDCTPWAVFDTEQAAKDYLEEMYGE